mmetsp:Transcript_26830/g.54497  ORF Transcript_26830/g.54497 Transcript_26830/m.54497 type:complete len:175 (-) Transcript_26830:73-597(-)
MNLQGKVIPWDSIGCVEEKELRWFNTKTWGMAADLKVWWHYDSIFRECKRHKGLVLHPKERQWVSPGLTPDNLDEVRRIIEARISTHSSLDAKISLLHNLAWSFGVVRPDSCTVASLVTVRIDFVICSSLIPTHSGGLSEHSLLGLAPSIGVGTSRHLQSKWTAPSPLATNCLQ